VRSSPALLGWARRKRLQPQVVNKAREWLSGKGDEALGDWDISRERRRTSAFRFPTRGKVFLCVAGCARRLSCGAENYFDTSKARASGETRSFQGPGGSDTSSCISSAKTSTTFTRCFWPAMLKFAGAPYKVPDHVYAHGFITVSARECRSRAHGHQPVAHLDIG